MIAHRMLAPNPGMMTLDGTNTWIVEGADGALVIDPGPDHAAHVAEILNRYRVVGVCLTHRHQDHSEALRSFPQELPVFAASPEFARGHAVLVDGDCIELGGVRLEVVATPGHTEDSVCFLFDDGADQTLCTGDTLLGRKHATYVSRRGGSLAQVLESLERLTAFEHTRGLPGHGEPIADVAEAARDALDYRRSRLVALREALRETPDLNPAQLARERHPHAPERWWASEWNIQIELDYVRGLR